MKKLLKIGLIIVGLLVVAAIVVYFAIDSIAKTAVEKGGTYAMGTKTTCDSVNIRLLASEVGLSGLTVANPEGFKTDHFLKTGRLDVGVEPGTLTKDTIVVTHFELDGVDLNIEHGQLGSRPTSRPAEEHGVVLPRPGRQEGGAEGRRPQDQGQQGRHQEHRGPRPGPAHRRPGHDARRQDPGTHPRQRLVRQRRRRGPARTHETPGAGHPSAVVQKGTGSITDPDFAKLGGDIDKTTKALGESFQKGAEGLLKGTGDLQKGVEGIFGGKKK